MKNKEIARILDEIADLYEMREVEFKPRAYRNAAQSIRALGEDIEDVKERGNLEDIPGVGSSIADKIREYIDTGTIKKWEDLKEDFPMDLEELTSVESLGPKKAKVLFEELDIKSLEDLKEAARKGKIKDIEGFGKKTQEKLLENIAFAEQKKGRFLLGYVIQEAEDIVDSLKDQCKKIEIAGSYRRKRETVGDIDILAVSAEKGNVVETFSRLDQVSRVVLKGEKKSTVKLNSGINVDLRMIEEESYGSALQYFTGSKQHNISLRKIAQKRGLKLNEYGLFEDDKRLAGRTEEEVYDELGMEWIPPEMRENNGEVEAAQNGDLPELVKVQDLRCDLQMHSDWSDGKASLKEMAEACMERGYEFFVITDHAGELTVANSLDLKRFREQRKEIDKLKEEMDMEIVHGVEANIKKSGRLDVPKEIIEEADLVLGSVHSSFRMERKKMTDRMVTAVKSGQFHILAHPTGRKIMEREQIDVDMDKLFEAASEAGTVLEVNAYPERLDLGGHYVKRAIDAGVDLSIGTDAHRKDHLRFIDLGVYTARRGWAEKKNIINTMTLKELKSRLLS
ncbi:MAG: DNA polymerase/3'-5' exonuclease PolX [Thermoplasmatota archaeon]